MSAEPMITVTGIYPHGREHNVTMSGTLSRGTLEWLDEMRDSTPEAFELFASLCPDGTGRPDAVLVEDSVTSWFDALTTDEMEALHERTSSVLDELAAAPAVSIRRSVAVNPHTPRVIINRLCADEDVEVVIAACSSARISAAGHLLVTSRIEAGDFDDMQARRLLRAITACPTVTSEALRACLRVCQTEGDLADFIASRLLARGD